MESDAGASSTTELHGIMAEFASPESLLRAAQIVRGCGYRHVEAYSPFFVEGLDEMLGLRLGGVQRATLFAGSFGAIAGYGLQYWVNVVAYPLNIGGRPLNSVPSFIPVSFEMCILCAALTAAVSMLVLNGLPRLHHAVFNVAAFAERASVDRFFLCVERTDPRFDTAEVRTLLAGCDVVEVHDVAG